MNERHSAAGLRPSKSPWFSLRHWTFSETFPPTALRDHVKIFAIQHSLSGKTAIITLPTVFDLHCWYEPDESLKISNISLL